MAANIRTALLTTVVLLTCSSAHAVDPLTDPTRPANYAWVAPEPAVAQPTMHWKLSAVKIGPTKSAIINGRVVFEGEEFGAATVIEIEPSAVLLAWSLPAAISIPSTT